MPAARAGAGLHANPFWCIRTGRLVLHPVAGDDLPELVALKADPRAFGLLLGGVRDPVRTDRRTRRRHRLLGPPRRRHVGGARGAEPRPCRAGRHHAAAPTGAAWRCASRSTRAGGRRGYASEAAAAALRFALGKARLARVVAVAREDNAASRELLAAIGMTLHETFVQRGWRMFLYECRAEPPDATAGPALTTAPALTAAPDGRAAG